MHELTGRKVGGRVRGTLLIVQQCERVQLVGGARGQLAQRVSPVAVALHGDVARAPAAALGALRQRDHLPTRQMLFKDDPPWWCGTRRLPVERNTH